MSIDFLLFVEDGDDLAEMLDLLDCDGEAQWAGPGGLVLSSSEPTNSARSLLAELDEPFEPVRQIRMSATKHRLVVDQLSELWQAVLPVVEKARGQGILTRDFDSIELRWQPRLACVRLNKLSGSYQHLLAASASGEVSLIADTFNDW